MNAELLAEADIDRRFSGLGRLFGEKQASEIRAAHVAVVGIGGVGSWAAEALARSGVASLTLIDMDHISESNVNRQIHALTTTLGMSKIEAMRERIALINPSCRVTLVDAFVEPETWPGVLVDGVDAVLDACDQVKAKTAMAEWAMRTESIFISVGAAGGKRKAQMVEIADLSATTHDPLLAQLRYRLRKFHGAAKEGKSIGLACVFSREAVQNPTGVSGSGVDGSLNCHGYGSLVTVTATFGFCAAGWIIEKISARGASAKNRTL